MKDKASIDKHKALQVAILMSKCSGSRIKLITYIQDAYEECQHLNIDILQHRLQTIAARKHPQVIVDVNYYMLCLRMEMQQYLRTL
jgi:hypothetical protein